MRWPGGSRAHTHHTPCLDTLGRKCPMHACQAVMINAMGAKKVSNFQRASTSHCCGIRKDVCEVPSVFEEVRSRRGGCHCRGTRRSLGMHRDTIFLLHEAAHNNKSVFYLHSNFSNDTGIYRYKTPDPFQHGGMHLQRVWRGAFTVVFFYLFWMLHQE